MTSEEFIAVLAGLSVVIGALLTFIANNISLSLREITKDLGVLNDKMTKIIMRVEMHENRLDSLEKKEK